MAKKRTKGYAINVSREVARWEIGTVGDSEPIDYELPPGAKVALGIGYLTRIGDPQGDTRPSFIERKTKGRVLPITDPRAQAYLEKAGRKVEIEEPEEPLTDIPSPDDLINLRKSELVDLAVERDIDPAGMTKRQLVEALEAAG
jgi:hypothetical protein